MSLRILAAFAFVALLAGCTTENETQPPRSAKEELLISNAADRAAEKLSLNIPRNTKVFVDTSNFEGTDSKYAASAIRDKLLRDGARFVDDKKAADAIIELRTGALSMEKKSFLIGIPTFSFPVPLSSSALTFPEIALYKSETQQGVAKFAFTAYDYKKGTLVQSQAPEFGLSHDTNKTVLIFISWSTNDIWPEDTDGQKQKTQE